MLRGWLQLGGAHAAAPILVIEKRREREIERRARPDYLRSQTRDTAFPTALLAYKGNLGHPHLHARRVLTLDLVNYAGVVSQAALK